MNKRKIYIIGLNSKEKDIPYVAVLWKEIQAVICSPRTFAAFAQNNPFLKQITHIPITPLTEALDRAEQLASRGPVAFLASGDPLFFGIARRCLERFGPEKVTVLPALSSIQHCFAAFRIPWDDAHFISLHGRNDGFHLGEILCHPKVALLCDAAHSPDEVCTRLYDFLGEQRSQGYTAFVAENIGMTGERYVSGTLAEIAQQPFGGMCCMVLCRPASIEEAGGRLGLSEEQISHTRGLITKNEVRSAVLHTLGMAPKMTLWDVGAGSGSIGIEAARICGDCLVYAVEKNEERLHNIKKNVKKYQLYTLKAVLGTAPQALEKLPTPDRVFIGGNGGHLSEIISYCSERLRPGGKIVITAFIEKTRNEAPQLLYKAGCTVTMSTVSVIREKYPTGEKQQFNPITIISAIKRS